MIAWIGAIGILIAATIAGAGIVPLRRHAHRLGLLDAPNERSSHRVVTPQGGGIAIIVAAVAAMLFFAAFGRIGPSAWILLAAAAGIGVLGALDDRFDLPAGVRFPAHLAAAVIAVAALGPFERLPLPAPLDVPLGNPVATWALSLLWLAAVTNFFNFMDGIDGLAGGQAAATCIGIVLAAWSIDAAYLALAVAGACIGFLFHNWSPARIFMGDAGSGFLGFILAGLPLLAPPQRRSEAVLAVGVGLTLFLVDPIVTLVKRARRLKNIFRAHREHLYQQLVAPEEPAGPVAAAYTAAALLLAVVGAVGYRAAEMSWLGPVCGLGAFVVVWVQARRAVARRSSRFPRSG